MKRIILIAVAVLAMSCDENQKQRNVTTKNGIEIELLFEKDGCKVYRFHDGHWVYYTDCRGKTEYNYTTFSGKTYTTHTQENQTIE